MPSTASASTPAAGKTTPPVGKGGGKAGKAAGGQAAAKGTKVAEEPETATKRKRAANGAVAEETLDGKKGKTSIQVLISKANKVKTAYHTVMSKAASLIDKVNKADDNEVWACLQGKWNIDRLDEQRKVVAIAVDGDMHTVLFQDLSTLRKTLGGAMLIVQLEKFIQLDQEPAKLNSLHNQM